MKARRVARAHAIVLFPPKVGLRRHVRAQSGHRLGIAAVQIDLKPHFAGRKSLL